MKGNVNVKCQTDHRIATTLLLKKALSGFLLFFHEEKCYDYCCTTSQISFLLQ